MNKFVENFQAFFEPLSPAQRIMFFLMIGLIVLFVGLLLRWTLQPDYAILFGSMHPEAAQEVVLELERRNVSYKIEDSGRSIFVPADRVHELRMHLASAGHANPGVQGYELFDSNTLGMTDFMQQVNKKRALEGELARSINSLEQVDFSRIHLVLPERTPFQQNAVPASASVILSLKRGQALSKQQVEGITALIAGSVQGLEPANVTVLDQNGNRLSDEMSADGPYAGGNNQIQIRQRTEAYLTERGQSMLDRVLGPGNSILRVAAEHDFDRFVRESDTLDPDSRVIINEQQRVDRANDEAYQQVSSDEFTPQELRGRTVLVSNRDTEQSTRNRSYDVNRSREVHERNPGEIRRITASVLLNYKRENGVDEEGNQVFQPYTQQEIQELQEVVRTALGINPVRGDELTITQIQFYDPTLEDQYRQWLQQPTPWNDIVRYVLILVALLAVIGLVYSMTRRLNQDSFDVFFKEPGKEVEQDQQKLAEGAAEPGAESITPDDFMQKKLSNSAREQIAEKSLMVDEIRKFAMESPEEASNAVRALMATD